MSLVNKFHSGLLNLHNDIILKICNQLDNKCQIVGNNQIKSVSIQQELLQQLEDRLNALENFNIVSNNDKKDNNIENILKRLVDIESKNIKSNISDISEIIRRLNNIEGNIEGSIGCNIGYSIYRAQEPSIEMEAKKRLESSHQFMSVAKSQADKLQIKIQNTIDKKLEIGNVVDPLIALTNQTHVVETKCLRTPYEC